MPELLLDKIIKISDTNLPSVEIISATNKEDYIAVNTSICIYYLLERILILLTSIDSMTITTLDNYERYFTVVELLENA